MQPRYLLIAALLTAGAGAVWFVKHPAQAAPRGSISDRVGMLPKLSHEEWAASSAQLAGEIRRMPAGPDKQQMVRVFADRITERGADHAVVQTVADTIVEMNDGIPRYDRGAVYWSLAHLAHYDHAAVSLDDPQYRAVLDQLEAQDKSRENADFHLAGIDGETWRLRDLRGKVVLVNFWATWCGDCLKEMPDIQALSDQFAPRGLVILAISDEDREKVAPFAAQRKYRFPVLLDAGDSVTKMFGVQGIPQTFLYNRDGKLVAHAVEEQTRGQFLAMLKAAGLI